MLFNLAHTLTIDVLQLLSLISMLIATKFGGLDDFLLHQLAV